ncbi:hypothetical protein I4U23_004870 [Adineta vaga]|nr:hypothetical protein I4U23_004870 [Adineta vaga]
MVEDWTKKISYEKYYNQCAPNTCSYSSVEHHNFIFVLTKIISLLGGLTLVLNLIIPKIVQFKRRIRKSEPVPKIPLHIRISQLRLFLQKTVYEFNLFQQQTTNDRQLRFQRIATRLHIICIAIALVVLTIYTSLSTNIYHETVLNPTETQFIELHQNYSTSLSCPCSSTSMHYSTFMAIQPDYHQMCLSDLVSSNWISYNYAINDIGRHYYLDYRASAGLFFYFLSLFCQEAMQTVTNALDVFLQTQLISSQVLSQEFFQFQSDSLIQNWQSTTTYQYVRTIEFMRIISHGNRLNNGHLNVLFMTNTTTRETTMTSQMYGNCSCGLSPCRQLLGIYEYNSTRDDYTLIFEIPHFYVGCYFVDFFFASTLECYYNRSCMIEIDRYMDIARSSTYNFSPLNSTLNSPYETIQSITNNLMVNSWSVNVSFTSYYSTCAPHSCTFVYERRMSIFLVITTVIGIFGGLSLGLKILIIVTLPLIEKIMNSNHRVHPIDFLRRCFTFHDQHRLIRQVHVLLLIIALCCLYMVSSFSPRLVTFQIVKPSLSTYQHLATRYSDTIDCTCSQVSIQYGLFLTVIPRFHQVCSSDFVSDRWITYIYDISNSAQQSNSSDFRYSATAQFQLLAALCRLAEETVNNTLLRLIANYFINIELLSEDALKKRIEMTVNQLEITTPNSYLSTMSLIRGTIVANMFLSGPTSSWSIDTPDVIVDGARIRMKPLMYDGCSCGSSSKCVHSSRGMLAGCYSLEALLQSTLHCLYDQQCIDPNHVFQAMNFSSSLSKSSRYDMNTTIESIVNQLMIEEYLRYISYVKYFEQCAPSSCDYSYMGKDDFIEGFTFLIGLYGGLLIICRAIAVIIVKLISPRISRVIPINVN